MTPKQTQCNTGMKISNNKKHLKVSERHHDHCHWKILIFNVMMINGILYESNVAVLFSIRSRGPISFVLLMNMSHTINPW